MKRLVVWLVAASLSGACQHAAPIGPDPQELLPVEGTMTDPRDGMQYRTVRLGGQEWMAENLRFLPRQDGDISTGEPRCYLLFDHDAQTELGAAFREAYGVFYNLPAALQGAVPLRWDEVGRIRGICPEGWHVPSQAEWQQLGRFVLKAGMAARGSDGEPDEAALGKALAAKTMWMLPEYTEEEPLPTWVGVEPEKNDAARFGGLPVGFRACAGDEAWMHSCSSAGWWSATMAPMLGTGFGVTVRIWSDQPTFVTTAEFSAGVGLPLRCLKD